MDTSGPTLLFSAHQIAEQYLSRSVGLWLDLLLSGEFRQSYMFLSSLLNFTSIHIRESASVQGESGSIFRSIYPIIDRTRGCQSEASHLQVLHSIAGFEITDFNACNT